MESAPSAILPGSAPFPANQWYVVAFSHEVTREPLARWVLNRPVVLYRDEAGNPVALYDRCPHRGYPLSSGRLIDDAIQCRYHGIEFAPDGGCRLIPSGGQITRDMKVTSFAVVERWKWIWMWAGDPAEADPALIPDHAMFDLCTDGWFAEPGDRLDVPANYLLPFENLLDATHVTFLHDGQLDVGDVAGKAMEVSVNGTHIRAMRRIDNELQTPLTMKTFGFPGTHATRTITADAVIPSLCGIRVDISPVSAPDQVQTNQLVVGITPRTTNSCYQFIAVAQSFPFNNPNWKADATNLLMEDVVAMGEIQQLFDRLPENKRTETGIEADRALYLARRIFTRLIRQEAV